jgi:trigger factor
VKFSNDNLNAQVEEKPKCMVNITIDVKKPLMDKAKKEAVKEVSKHVTIPGFRKGKAPADFVEKKHGKEIQKEWQKKCANLAFSEAMKDVKKPLLNNNTPVNYSLKEWHDDKAAMLFSFETEPEVPSIDPKQCKIKEVKVKKITKKELDESIRQMQFFFAQWIPVTDRPIEEKDFIIIDLETLEDPKKKVFSDTRFEVTKESMADWMREAVIGKKVEDTIETISKPDASLSEKEKKEFKPKRVLITIKKVEQAELPKIDEEFAQKVGTKSVEELRENVQKNLEQKAEEKASQETRHQINDFLLTHSFELPESLVSAEKKHRLQEIINNPRHEPKWNDLKPEEKNQVEQDVQKQAEEAVKLFYLSRSIVKEMNIQVSQTDIQQEVMQSLQQLGLSQAAQKEIPKEFYTLAFSKVILKKAQDYILENLAK